MEDRDKELLERYAISDRTVPRVRANFIASLDGAATHDGRTSGLNNADDKKVFDILRMLCDVVLVGAGTLRTEGYADLRVEDRAVLWRIKHGLPAQPTLAVVSGRLALNPEMAAFAKAPARPIIFTCARSSAQKRQDLSRATDVIVCGEETLHPQAMLGSLAQRGFRQVLCEGGPRLLGTLVEADCVDELCLTLSPVLENGSAGRITAGAPQTPRGMRLGHVISVRDMLLLRYERSR
jgi:riboflavin biosynthesis pyrimidine reductase